MIFFTPLKPEASYPFSFKPYGKRIIHMLRFLKKLKKVNNSYNLMKTKEPNRRFHGSYTSLNDDNIFLNVEKLKQVKGVSVNPHLSISDKLTTLKEILPVINEEIAARKQNGGSGIYNGVFRESPGMTARELINNLLARPDKHAIEDAIKNMSMIEIGHLYKMLLKNYFPAFNFEQAKQLSSSTNESKCLSTLINEGLGCDAELMEQVIKLISIVIYSYRSACLEKMGECGNNVDKAVLSRLIAIHIFHEPDPGVYQGLQPERISQKIKQNELVVEEAFNRLFKNQPDLITLVSSAGADV